MKHTTVFILLIALSKNTLYCNEFAIMKYNVTITVVEMKYI